MKNFVKQPFFGVHGSGGNPNPYDPNWKKENGEWKNINEAGTEAQSGSKSLALPNGLTAKGKVAWEVSKITGEDFETLMANNTMKELKNKLNTK